MILMIPFLVTTMYLPRAACSLSPSFGEVEISWRNFLHDVPGNVDKNRNIVWNVFIGHTTSKVIGLTAAAERNANHKAASPVIILDVWTIISRKA